MDVRPEADLPQSVVFVFPEAFFKEIDHFIFEEQPIEQAGFVGLGGGDEGRVFGQMLYVGSGATPALGDGIEEDAVLRRQQRRKLFFIFLG